MYGKIEFRGSQAYEIQIDDDGNEIAKPLDSLIDKLNYQMKIRDNSTLFKHIWRYIECDAEFFQIVFAGAIGNHNIQPFIDQFHKPSSHLEEEDPEDRIDYLEITWSADTKYDENEKRTIVDNIILDFGGVGPYKLIHKDGSHKIENIGKALDFITVNDLSNYPIRLNEKWKARSCTDPNVVLFDGSQQLTVYNVFEAILSEITFHGYPNEKIRMASELDQQMASMKDVLNDLDAKIEGTEDKKHYD